MVIPPKLFQYLRAVMVSKFGSTIRNRFAFSRTAILFLSRTWSSKLLILALVLVSGISLQAAGFLDEDVESRLANGAGAKSFNSPEIILKQPWNCSADIWSLGASVKHFIPLH